MVNYISAGLAVARFRLEKGKNSSFLFTLLKQMKDGFLVCCVGRKQAASSIEDALDAYGLYLRMKLETMGDISRQDLSTEEIEKELDNFLAIVKGELPENENFASFLKQIEKWVEEQRINNFFNPRDLFSAGHLRELENKSQF